MLILNQLQHYLNRQANRSLDIAEITQMSDAV